MTNDKNDKNETETKRKTNKLTKRQRDRESPLVAQQLNIFLYQASIIASH